MQAIRGARSTQPAHAADAGLTVAFRALRGRRVFFAHQSVGANLLQGLQQLGAALPGLAPALLESARPEPIASGVWQHARLGQNGLPLLKLERLREWIDAGLGARVDVVLFKLCYADVGPATQVEDLHAVLMKTLEGLRERFRDTRFVPMTVPLTAPPRGLRAHLKRCLLLPPGGAAENARRHALNERLRAHQSPLFDLAAYEALDPSGVRAEVSLGGQKVPVLAPQNTSDGGHLVPAAQVRIARKLVEFVAGLA
jgi:hypothetical protein